MFRLHEQQVVFDVIWMNQSLIDQPMAVIANVLNRTGGIICEKRILLYRDIFPVYDIKAGQLQRVFFQNMCDGFRDRWNCLIAYEILFAIVLLCKTGAQLVIVLSRCLREQLFRISDRHRSVKK